MSLIMTAIDDIQFSYKFHDEFVQRMQFLACQDWQQLSLDLKKKALFLVSNFGLDNRPLMRSSFFNEMAS